MEKPVKMMNTDETKNLLAGSAASTGEPDTNWTAAAVDRMYFHNPNNQDVCGCVDVQRSEPGQPGPERVKVELWIEPARAAEIIAMVTGRTASFEEKIAALVQSGKLPHAPKPPAVTLPPPPVTFGKSTALPPPPTALDEADRKRALELEVLIAQQVRDEAREAAGEVDEPEKKSDEDEENEGLPDEVSFDEG